MKLSRLSVGIGLVVLELGVHEARIKTRVNPSDVLANQKFQPSFRLCAEGRMAKIGGQRMSKLLEVCDQFLECRLRRRR
jgi:hypothetical protein